MTTFPYSCFSTADAHESYRVRTKLENPWKFLNLETKIKGLQSPWVYKEVHESPYIVFALVDIFWNCLALRIGHFVNWFCSCLTKTKVVWNSLKLPFVQFNVTFYWFLTPFQPLVLEFPGVYGLGSPWKVLEFNDSSWPVRTLVISSCFVTSCTNMFLFDLEQNHKPIFNPTVHETW
jgi:hypothetical protein